LRGVDEAELYGFGSVSFIAQKVDEGAGVV